MVPVEAGGGVMTRRLDREEAIDRALLYVFQLSGKDYEKMRTAFSSVSVIRALEQDGWTIAPTAPAPLDALTLCEERERDLREALRDGSYFHIAHDGSVRHPTTCNDCRALDERHAAAETPRT